MSRDLRSLLVLCNFQLRMRTPKGTPNGSNDLRSHPVAMLLLLRKKRGEKPGMRRTYFRSGPLPDRVSSSHVTLSLPIKRPTRANMAQLPVAHAHNILPDMATSGHMTDVTSGHVTSGRTTSQHHLKCGFVRAHILLINLVHQHFFLFGEHLIHS